MKSIFTAAMVIFSMISIAQETEKTSDTTKINMGENEIWIIKKPKTNTPTITDTIDAAPHLDDEDDENHEGHWGGINFGTTMLMNSAMKSSFPNNSFLENDPAKSFYWDLNFMDYKFNVYKHYVGITTGMGVNFTQIGIKDNQILRSNSDSLWLINDTINTYSKNKLRGTYLQIPLLLEFNTKADDEKSFYVAAGVIGGVRVGSALIQKIDNDNSNNKLKTRGTYGLNPFKCDATLRVGYGDWGIFANYALLPLFDTKLTDEAYPLTFGLSMNF
ncbi:MAG: outer membrane beta-barrel protein [Flavobacteriia bacterium]|jgi:hypothetical protein